MSDTIKYVNINVCDIISALFTHMNKNLNFETAKMVETNICGKDWADSEMAGNAIINFRSFVNFNNNLLFVSSISSLYCVTAWQNPT